MQVEHEYHQDHDLSVKNVRILVGSTVILMVLPILVFNLGKFFLDII